MNQLATTWTEPPPVFLAAQCLVAYLSVHGKGTQQHDVLRFLAKDTLARESAGLPPAEVSNHAIKQVVAPDSDKDPSAWLSPVWKKLEREMVELEAGLSDFARLHGYSHYPWIKKRDSGGGAGNKSGYMLDCRWVSEIPLDETKKADDFDVTYIAAAKIAPSWWTRWLFSHDYAAGGWRKALLVGAPIAAFIVLGLLGSLLFAVLGQSRGPVMTQDLLLALMIVVVYWLCRRIIFGLDRLMDDRIMLAPDHLVGLNEFGVCLELTGRPGEKKGPRVLSLVKYAAECPICGAEILLEKGEPDFPRRLVGRCQESPREHVFSFDRAFKAGYQLRPEHRM